MTPTAQGNGWPTPEAGPVLVTGGCGFLGHHLVARLLNEGYAVTVLDDLSTGVVSNLPEDERVRFIEGSVLDPAACRKAGQGMSALFHLAGVVGMRLAVGDRDKAYKIAVEGTRNVLEATPGVPAILYSSSAVYGLTSRVAVAESDTPGETGVMAYDGGYRGYATGKWDLEAIGQEAAQEAGRSILIVRPFNAVGEGQTGTYGMVVPSFISMARSGEPLTVYDDGGQSRTFSHVGTFVEALIRLVNQPEAWVYPNNVFNIGTSESTTIGELAQIVLDETGSDSDVHYIPYGEIFPGKVDVRARVPDTTRLESLIGSVEWPTIREVVRRLVHAGVGAASGH